MKLRVSRPRNRIIWGICHLAHGEAPDAYNSNPEFLGMPEPFGGDYDRLINIHDCM
jgi:hypothetical protein